MWLDKEQWVRDVAGYVETCKCVANGVGFHAPNQPQEFSQAVVIADRQEASLSDYVHHTILPLMNMMGIRQPGRVLSVGCGLGAREHILSRLGYEVVGVDIVLSSLVFARRHWDSERKTWGQASGERLPFRSESFDAVVSFQLLEHIPDILSFHSEAFRILRAGGVYLGVTANYLGILSHSFEEGEDTIMRRLGLLPRIAHRLASGYFRNRYTAKVPFESFRYGLDHKFVSGFKHHLDPEDLHPLNPFEIKRLLGWAGFSGIQVFTIFSDRTVLRKVFTMLYRIPPMSLLGPNVIATARKPMGVKL
jgi:ubiquinone/menaquinone biosynthesis C-methylase UbiE